MSNKPTGPYAPALISEGDVAILRHDLGEAQAQVLALREALQDCYPLSPKHLWNAADRKIVNALTNSAPLAAEIKAWIEREAVEEYKLEVCPWVEDEDEGLWDAGCGLTQWFFDEGGTPAEHRMKFCPGCGKRLVILDRAAGLTEEECDD